MDFMRSSSCRRYRLHSYLMFRSQQKMYRVRKGVQKTLNRRWYLQRTSKINLQPVNNVCNHTITSNIQLSQDNVICY